MSLPKIKYVANPKKSKEQNEQSEKTFRQSTKFVFAQCILAPILGLFLSQFAIIYFISGISLFIVIYLLSKLDRDKNNSKKLEFSIYFLSGTSFALIIASIFAIIVQAIAFII